MGKSTINVPCSIAMLVITRGYIIYTFIIDSQVLVDFQIFSSKVCKRGVEVQDQRNKFDSLNTVRASKCTCRCIYVYIYIYLHIHTYIYIHICIYLHIYICRSQHTVYVIICIYMSICVHAHESVDQPSTSIYDIQWYTHVSINHTNLDEIEYTLWLFNVAIEKHHF